MTPSLSYRDLVEHTAEKEKSAHEKLVDEATAKQAMEIARKAWLSLPSTIEFLQILSADQKTLDTVAKNAALSGDNDKCARTLVQVATIETVINKAKYG